MVTKFKRVKKGLYDYDWVEVKEPKAEIKKEVKEDKSKKSKKSKKVN